MLVSERQPKRRKILGLAAAAPAIYFRIFLFFLFGCAEWEAIFFFFWLLLPFHIPIFVFGQTGSQCAREEENVRRSRASSVGDQHPILW